MYTCAHSKVPDQDLKPKPYTQGIFRSPSYLGRRAASALLLCKAATLRPATGRSTGGALARFDFEKCLSRAPLFLSRHLSRARQRQAHTPWTPCAATRFFFSYVLSAAVLDEACGAASCRASRRD